MHLFAALVLATLLDVSADDRAEVKAMLEAGRQREAADVMTRLLADEPEQRGLRSDLVKLEMRIGRYASALAHCESLGEQFDSTRGKALYMLGRYDEALEFLMSDVRESILFRHESLWVLARFEEAAVALEQAAKLLGAEHVEVRTRRGQALARDGKLKEAAVEFRSALEPDPLSAAALFGLGRALLSLDEREEGIALLERHRAMTPLIDKLDFAKRNLELDLSHAPNHAAVGDALRALFPYHAGLKVEARTSYASAAKLAKAAEVVPIALRCARFFEEDMIDADEAVRVLDTAFVTNLDARLPVRAGDILMRAEQPQKALEQFLRALHMRPRDGAIQGRVDAARKAITK